MGERREGNPNKRMLFTEFGSPAGYPDASAAEERPRRPLRAASLPTLEELTSSLDLDFEDDLDFPPPKASADKRYGDDESFEPPAVRSPRPPNALYAPPPPIEKDEAEKTRIFEYAPFVQDAFAAIGSGLAEPEDRNGREPAEAGETDMDLDDILSAVPPPFTNGASAESTMAWRGQRLGVEPPPAVPYGGIERVDEWYRPPEREGRAGDAALPEEAPSDAEPPADAAMSNRGSASAIFSDLDLESIWEERTASAGARVDAPEAVRDGRTTVMPLARDAQGRAGSETKREIREAAEETRGTEMLAHKPPALDERPDRRPAGRGAKQDKVKPYRRPASAIDVGGHGFLADAASESAPAGVSENVAATLNSDAIPPGADVAASVSRADAVEDIASASDGKDDIEQAGEGARAGLDESKPAAGGLSNDAPPDEPGLENDDEYLPEAEPDADAETGNGRDESTADPAGLGAVVSGRSEPDAGAPAPEGDGSEPAAGMAAILSGDSAAGAPAETAAALALPSSGADAQADDAAIASGGQADSIGEAVAVNPEDVFSNFDDMDFEDDGLDDEMKAMLDDGDGQNKAAEPAPAPPERMMEDDAPPADAVGKIVYRLKKMLLGVIPAGVVKKAAAMIAWRENWWFYLDLLAAIIASASLAIIISYFIWYRK